MDPPATSSSRFAVRGLAVGGGAVVALTLLQLVRVSGVPVYRTLWAEDGSVFLPGALSHESFFTTHAGYLNVVPRTLAWFATLFPLDWASTWFAVVPALLTSLLAVAVFHLADFVVRSKWLRLVLALAFILPPILVYETMAVTANLQWPLVGALFWALARPVSARWDLITCGVIVVGAALSSSVALLFVPLALLVVALRRRDRRALIVPSLFGLACCAQLVAVLTTAASAARGQSTVSDLPRLYVVNVVGETVLGHRLVDEAWLGPGLAVFVVLAVALAAMLLLLWSRCDDLGRLWGGRALAALIVVQAVLIPLTAFRLLTLRSDGPRWSSALSAARRECRREPRPAVRVLPITPAGFTAEVSCRDLD